MKIILILLVLYLLFGRRERRSSLFSGLFTLMGLGVGYVLLKIFLFAVLLFMFFGGLAFLGLLL